MVWKRPFTAFLAANFVISPVFADLYEFRESTFQAIQHLESQSLEVFKNSPEALNRAYDSAIDRRNRKLVGAAIDLFNENTKVSDLSSDANISKTIVKLREAISTRSVLFGKSHPGEIELIEKLIKLALFPNNPDKVNITFEGVDRAKGLSALAAFIADPRTARNDNLVSSIVLGKDIFGQETGMQVKFLVEAAEFDLPNSGIAVRSSNEEKSTLDALVEAVSMSVDRDSSIRGKVRVLDRRAFLYYEFKGYQYVEMINDYVLGNLALAGGNRYIMAVANQLEKTAEVLQTARVGGVPILRDSVNAAGKKVADVERILRNRLATPWFEPNPETIVKIAEERSALRIVHMQKNLEARIAAIKASDIDDVLKQSKIKELTEQTEKWVASEKVKNAKILQNIKKSISTTQRSLGFSKLPKPAQAQRLLAAAEKASGIRTMTFERLMKGVTALTVGYYIYKGIAEMIRSENGDQRLQAYNFYSVKAAHAALYFFPFTREAAAALDLTALVVGWPLESTTGIKIPDTSDVLFWIQDKSGNIGYRMAGLTRFKYFELDLRNNLNVPVLLFHNNNWKDIPLQKLSKKSDSCLKEQDQPLCVIEMSLERDKFKAHLSNFARKHLALLYFANQRVDNEGNGEFAKLTEQLRNEILNPNNGYNNFAKQVSESIEIRSKHILEELMNGSIELDEETKIQIAELLKKRAESIR